MFLDGWMDGWVGGWVGFKIDVCKIIIKFVKIVTIVKNFKL
jgi:hypothetical protein